MGCESPRLATIPIVAQDMSWDIGDPPGNWPNGRKDMKFIGFLHHLHQRAELHRRHGGTDRRRHPVRSEAECSDGGPFQPAGSTNSIAGHGAPNRRAP